MNEISLNKCINYYNFRSKHSFLAYLIWSIWMITLLSIYFFIIPNILSKSLTLNTTLDGNITLGFLITIFLCSIFEITITLVSSKVCIKLELMYNIGKLNKEIIK